MKFRFVSALVIALISSGPAMAQGTEVPFSTFTRDPNAAVEISADSLSIDQADGAAIFEGNVVAGQGDLRLTAGKIRVEYAGPEAENAGAILRIHADGDVILKTAGETAKGQSAVYDLDGETITMTGDVVLTQGANAVSGDEMVLDLASNRARFIGRVKTILQAGGSQ